MSWTRENGRSSDLAKALGADLVHIYPKGRLLRRYLVSALQSRKIIASLRHDQAAFFMLPPAPLAVIARLARSKQHSRNFYDLHTGFFFDPKWQWASLFALRLMRGSSAIVTNANLAHLCKQAGVRTYILHDVLRRREKSVNPGPLVVCPLSYSNDEPIEDILTAARNLPETRWLFTGNAPSKYRSSAPVNVEFSGFLDDAAYEQVIQNAALVVALTTRRDTMQRAAYEAIMYGVPVVTSDFEVLRDFFEDSAVYVAEDASNLEQQIRIALNERVTLALRSEAVLEQRMAEQELELFALREMLHAGLIGEG